MLLLCVFMLWIGLRTKVSGLGLESLVFWLQTVVDIQDV